MNKLIKIQKIVATSLIVISTITAVGCSNKSISLNTLDTTTSKYSSIFKKDSVIDIKIEIAEEDFKSILSDPMAEEYKSANVTVDGTTIKNVGFRTKGNSTLKSVANTDSERYSFRIKLDKYVDGQNLLGLDEFVVNNMYSDPSYMREYLSYEALREIGANVPETVFANIYINNELYGFYLCVEAIDNSFLERSFGNNNGNLYKQEQGSTLKDVEGSNYDKSELKVGDDEAKAGLKNFIKSLNEVKEEKGNIESVLDVDSALRYIAANTVLGSYDSYSGNMSHNYYLYEQNGKFTVIPWDYNMSMGGFGMGGGDATTIPIDEPVMGVKIENLPLINNLLLIEEYKEKYHEYVKQFLTYLENSEKRVEELATIIRPYIKADPTKFYTLEQFEANIKYSESTENSTGTTPTQNTDGKALGQGQEQMPEERRTPPEGFQNGNMPVPPEGGVRGDMKGGPNGGMKMTGGSIINYIRDRVTNLKKQLSGELPTTGNTTMNNNRMEGNRQ